jgi:steroid 5-alpha reductase family enzyme
MSGKASALGLVTLAYLLCIAAALATLYAVDLPQPWNAFAADVVATVVIFIFSRRYRNSSFYDPYWSVIPPLLAIYWYCANAQAGVDAGRALLVIGLAWLWGIRLTANWATFWGGLTHEDWRYPLVRERAGRFAFLADFFGIHFYPTVQVFLGCLPIYAVMTRGQAPLGWLDGVAAAVTLGAIAIETIADLQLHTFIKTRQPGTFIQSGLWGWSRHPNYFGEVGFWWGLMLFGLAAAPEAWWWIMPGAVTMLVMFLGASIPFMDKRNLQRKPAYAEYMRRTSALLPLPPRG